jgi:hypothetical protein
MQVRVVAVWMPFQDCRDLHHLLLVKLNSASREEMDRYQTPSITAGCSSGHVFSVEFLRSLILRPQVSDWNEKGQWSLRYAWLCRAGVGVKSLRREAFSM